MDIPMNYLVSSGMRQEPSQSFTDSFFEDIYRQALNAIALTIHTNRVRFNSVKHNVKKDEPVVYDVQNTIAFTGRRGTGKTSAMISVRNCLFDPYSIPEKLCDDITKKELESVQFRILPKMIDASHLDEKEDLLEVIIANMLKELNDISSDRNFDEEGYGQKTDELKRRMAKVQNDYDSLIQTNGKTIHATYPMLIQGADKHNIQSEFKSIVDEYLRIMSESRCDSSDKTNSKAIERYLVICIDDIDMYPGDPMLIMQCIYRYFTLPNILVLTSWNYNMLYQYIFKHYFKRMTIEKADNKDDHSERERLCHDQSNDYLRKLIPYDKRIVMPSWKKSDYRELIEKNIRLYSKEEFADKFKEQFPRLYPGRFYNVLFHKVNAGVERITVKEFIFLLIADRTGIYLDASGTNHILWNLMV